MINIDNNIHLDNIGDNLPPNINHSSNFIKLSNYKKIENIIFNGEVNFGRGNLIESKNIIFNKKLIFSEKVIDRFIFENCVFKKELLFDNEKYIFKGNVIFKDCKFEKGLFFRNSIFEGKLEIIDCVIKGNGLSLYNINTLKRLYIASVKGKELNINNIVLKYFDTISKDECNYFIYHLLDTNLKIINSSNISDKFIIGNSKINKLFLQDILLGKTTFNGVKIDKLYLENATLNDCIFNGVEFLNDYKLEEIKDEKGNVDYFKMKDNYRQLKFVMDKNGNITEANKFFAKEMEAYYLALKWKENFSRKLLLFIQNIISFFGNNWILSLIWIFALVLITTGISYYYMDFYKNINIDYIKSFLFFLYPLYGLKKDFFEGFDNWMLSGFMTYKLIYGILLWHLVVALKRTTKR